MAGEGEGGNEPAPASVPTDVPDGVQHVVRLRQDFLLEVRRVGDRAVECRDATDRRVEMVEQLVGDPRRDFRAEPARQLVLVRDDDAVGLLDQRAMPVQSYGMIVRRSKTATLRPSVSACWAATMRRCTSAPQVRTTTSVPSRRSAPLPNGIM